MDKLSALYIQHFGSKPDSIAKLAGAGSSRRYYRLCGTHDAIGCKGDDRAENKAFIYLSSVLKECSIPVPEVYAVTGDSSAYIQQDLGDESLFDRLQSTRLPDGGFPEETVRLLKKAIRTLAKLQWKGREKVDFTRCYPSERMDSRMVMWDLNYFKYCFLRVAGIEFDEARLQDDFDRMCSDILDDSETVLMLRDFQSRNIMIVDETPWIIDFQGARRGPAEYDVASFLWQARAAIPQQLREMLVDEYLDAAGAFANIDREQFKHRLMKLVLLRTLQVLGAYGLRGIIEGKSHFIKSIPAALANLSALTAAGHLADYPTLEKAAIELTRLPQFASGNRNGLTVRIVSFSYHKGIPHDFSGNGGGFVFDCRAIHNPGRYDRYKQLTGRDEPVIQFLEEDGEILRFLDNVYGLIDPAVERYISRGFNNLMVCFGCTGGQHRSLYSADALAKHLHEKYGVRIVLEHREQSIKEVIE